MSCFSAPPRGREAESRARLARLGSALSFSPLFHFIPVSERSHLAEACRCQSPQLPGFARPRPLLRIIRSLPWRGSLNQLLLFSGILGLNVRLIQWKIQLKEEDQELEE